LLSKGNGRGVRKRKIDYWKKKEATACVGGEHNSYKEETYVGRRRAVFRIKKKATFQNKEKNKKNRRFRIHREKREEIDLKEGGQSVRGILNQHVHKEGGV